MRQELWAPRGTAFLQPPCLPWDGLSWKPVEVSFPGHGEEKCGQVEGGQGKKGKTHHSPHPGNLETFWRGRGEASRWEWGQGSPKPAWSSPHMAAARSHVPVPRAPPVSPQGLTLLIRISLYIWCSPNSAPWELERMARQAWVHQFPTDLCPGLSSFTSVRSKRPYPQSQGAKHSARHTVGALDPSCFLPLPVHFPISLRGVTSLSNSAWAPATCQACARPRPELQRNRESFVLQ